MGKLKRKHKGKWEAWEKYLKLDAGAKVGLLWEREREKEEASKNI